MTMAVWMAVWALALPTASRNPEARFPLEGDGATNDLPSLQNALNYVTSNGGGRILLPCGTFRVATPWDFTGVDNVTVEGIPCRLQSLTDRPGTWIENTGSGYALQLISTPAIPVATPLRVGVWLRGLGFAATNNHAVRISQTNKVKVEDCTILGGNAGSFSGLHLDRVGYLTIEGTRFYRSQNGLLSANSPSSVDAGGPDYVNQLRMYGCEFSVGTAGVNVHGASIVVRDSTFEGGKWGVRVSMLTPNGTSTNACVVQGCYFEAVGGAGGSAMQLGGASGINGCLVEGNYMNLTLAAGALTYMELSGNSFDVRGNSFYGIAGDPATDQIRLANIAHVRIGPNAQLSQARVNSVAAVSDLTFVGVAA